MARLKRPDLPLGPLRDLNDALHDLHQRAGLPSVRDLARSVGAGVASRSRIHDAFTDSRLPSWGLVQLLARALAQTVPAGDIAREEKDLHALWLMASGAAHIDHPIEEPTDPDLTVGANAILAMRVEWESPIYGGDWRAPSSSPVRDQRSPGHRLPGCCYLSARWQCWQHSRLGPHQGASVPHGSDVLGVSGLRASQTNRKDTIYGSSHTLCGQFDASRSRG